MRVGMGSAMLVEISAAVVSIIADRDGTRTATVRYVRLMENTAFIHYLTQ